MDLVTLDQIREAASVIEGIVQRTPLERSRSLSSRTGGEVWIKCENLQRTGSFKMRGAYNRISRLSEDERARGVVAASAGNHAQGVALAAQVLGVSARIFMPEGTPIPKVEATRGYGADIVLQGIVYDDALSNAEEFAQASGGTLIHPFEHPDIIAGQGTVALELMEQLAAVRTVVVPIGGGGLIAGIAAGMKALSQSVKVIGVEPVGAAGVRAALDAGEIVTLPSTSTIADGLLTKRTTQGCLDHIRTFVDDVVTVTDEEISEALLLLLERVKMVVEPAGAASTAALLRMSGIEFPAVVVASGGNIDPLMLLRIIRNGMGAAGRYFRFQTKVPDRPGELAKMLGVLAEAGANVASVEHHREGASLTTLSEVEVELQVETRGRTHIEELLKVLKEKGYEVT